MKTTPTMQRVITALATAHGLDLTQEGAHLRLTLAPYMPLVIEVLLPGMISVAHYYEQNGDLIADPDVEIFTFQAGWAPAAITQPIGGYRNYVEHPRGQGGLADFCETWARNIEAQGWLTHGRRDGDDTAGAAVLAAA